MHGSTDPQAFQANLPAVFYPIEKIEHPRVTPLQHAHPGLKKVTKAYL
jgi:hypothetical protein